MGQSEANRTVEQGPTAAVGTGAGGCGLEDMKEISAEARNTVERSKEERKVPTLRENTGKRRR